MKLRQVEGDVVLKCDNCQGIGLDDRPFTKVTSTNNNELVWHFCSTSCVATFFSKAFIRNALKRRLMYDNKRN